jgi:S-formylglutathione hydrolase
MDEFVTLAEHRCFDGVQGFYAHRSTVCGVPMRFAVYRPPQAEHRRVPVLYYLSGLGCTEENFPMKAGAQRLAAELGLLLVVPDTSPRGTGIPGEADDEHFGVGASLYVDATELPWSRHFQMYTYVSTELPRVIAARFPADLTRESVFGHSMGGHGALIVALKQPRRYRSVSAFAPICAPSETAWTARAFTRYLGADRAGWTAYDACALVQRGGFPGTILIDQGEADPHLPDLLPERFVAACRASGQALCLRMQRGYDHGYYFVASFIDDHLRHHAAALTKQ